eukprot:jgi/Astpho2/9904/Aster-06616
MVQRSMPVSIKSPEGDLEAISHRTHGAADGDASQLRVTTLAHAELPDRQAYMLFNYVQSLAICEFNKTGQTPLRTMAFKGESAQKDSLAFGIQVISCHCYQAAADSLDILVGCVSGLVFLANLQAHLQRPHTEVKANPSVQIGTEGPNDKTRCTGVAWLPASNGMLFAVAHQSGALFVYNKANVTDKALLNINSSKGPTCSPAVILQPSGSCNALAVSPDGSMLATACQDGVARIYSTAKWQLLATMAVSFALPGVQTAGVWPQGVSLFSVPDRCVVAYGRGHSSFVMHVTFDHWVVPEVPLGSSQRELVYRLGSVGQDCQMLLWDMAITEEAVAAMGPPGASPEFSAHGGQSRRSSFHTAASTPTSVHSSSPIHMRHSSHEESPLHPRSVSLEGDLISPAARRADMFVVSPVAGQRLAMNVLTHLLFVKDGLFVADSSAGIRVYLRPQAGYQQPVSPPWLKPPGGAVPSPSSPPSAAMP